MLIVGSELDEAVNLDAAVDAFERLRQVDGHYSLTT